MSNVWDTFFAQRGRYYLLPHEFIPKLIQKMKNFNLNKVLDIGCGSGRNSIELAKEGFKVTGIDFSMQALNLAKKWAKKENLKIKFEKVDIREGFPYNKNTFHAAIAIDSIHYDTIDTVNLVIKEINRVLIENGLAYITLPTYIGNPLITHLIFTKDEITNMIRKYFKILYQHTDSNMYYCTLAIKTN